MSGQKYRRTSVARTLMAHLPWLFQTCSGVSGKNSIAADIIVFGMIKGDFLFYIENDMFCVLIRIASVRRF